MFNPCREDAETLFRAFCDTPLRRNAPKGYRRIGEGTSRSVYVRAGSEGIVYKLGDSESNNSEYRNSRSFSKKAGVLKRLNLHIPHTTIYDFKTNNANMEDLNVLAMEYVQGETTYCASNHYGACTCKRRNVGICFNELHAAIEQSLNMSDAHSDNILVNRHTRTHWLIDLDTYNCRES